MEIKDFTNKCTEHKGGFIVNDGEANEFDDIQFCAIPFQKAEIDINYLIFSNPDNSVLGIFTQSIDHIDKKDDTYKIVTKTPQKINVKFLN